MTESRRSSCISSKAMEIDQTASGIPMSATNLADEYWAYRVANSHFENLSMGELLYLERWDDLSAEGIDSNERAYAGFAKRAVEISAVSATDQILLDTVEAAARMDASIGVWWAELQSPSRQVGLITDLVPGLHLQPLITADHGARYIEKIRALPNMIFDLAERLEEGAAKGIVPVQLHVEQTVGAINQMLDVALEDDPILAQLPPDEMSSDEAELWRQNLAAAVGSSYREALVHFRDVLVGVTFEASRPTTQPGLCHLSSGDDVYRAMVKGHTTVDLSPEEIHEIGLSQVDRLEDEYRRLAGPLMGTTDVDEIYQRLRDDPALHYADADQVVADSLHCLEKATAVMGDWFDPVPQADCVATAIDVGPMAYYRPPPQDGSRPGEFFFNIADPGAWGTFQVPAIAYHEGIPGHHLQLALGIENHRIHDLHRLCYIPAYGEGWGLYTEQLADEMGLYEDDMERVGMLTTDSMRGGRLVVDTGMHALGWTRQQAIDYFADHSPMAMHEIEEEIDRYIAMPGQALSYMVGRLEIDEIRSLAELALGDRFDIKAFHNVVLGNGTVPLATLRRMVEAWVASVNSRS